MRNPALTAVLLLVLSPLAATAQQYAIKVKRPAVGDKTHVKIDDTTEISFKVLGRNNNALIDKQQTKYSPSQ
jgi:hypothetical protein